MNRYQNKSCNLKYYTNEKKSEIDYLFMLFTKL